MSQEAERQGSSRQQGLTRRWRPASASDENARPWAKGTHARHCQLLQLRALTLAMMREGEVTMMGWREGSNFSSPQSSWNTIGTGRQLAAEGTEASAALAMTAAAAAAGVTGVVVATGKIPAVCWPSGAAAVARALKLS